jgi:hypothetical protein
MRKAKPIKINPEPRLPERPSKTAAPEIDTKVLDIAVDAARAAQGSAESVADALIKSVENQSGGKAEIIALRKSVDRLAEILMMPTELEVRRDSSDIIKAVRIHKLKPRRH